MKNIILVLLLGLTSITANADFNCDHGDYSPFNGEATVVEKEDGAVEFHMDLNRVRYSRRKASMDGREW